jgi:hypothetical protein
MILVYPVGIPLLYAVVLRKHRETLVDPVAMAREAANGYPVTGSILFLVECYKPEYYYFEVIVPGSASLTTVPVRDPYPWTLRAATRYATLLR